MPKRKPSKSSNREPEWTVEEKEALMLLQLAPELLECLIDCNMLLLTHYDVGKWPDCVKRALSLIGQSEGLKP